MDPRPHTSTIIIPHYLESTEGHLQDVIHIWTTSQTSQTPPLLVPSHARGAWRIRVWIARLPGPSPGRVSSTCFESVASLVLSLFPSQTLRSSIAISWLPTTSSLHLGNTLILRYSPGRKRFYTHLNSQPFTTGQYSDFTVLCGRRLVISQTSSESGHDPSAKKLCSHLMTTNHEV